MLEPPPSGHRKMVRRAVAACAALTLAAFIVGLSAVPAFAVTCSGGATMTIGVAGGASIALSLSGEADPLAIVVTPSDPGCGGFDTSTVTAIQVNGTGASESVTIDQSGSAPFPHQNSTEIDLALGAGADALVIVTEWLEFRNPDFDRLKSLLKRPIIVDGRNLYDPKKLRKLGFTYHGIGRRGTG